MVDEVAETGGFLGELMGVHPRFRHQGRGAARRDVREAYHRDDGALMRVEA
jgi:hypothetical protein